MSLRIGTRGSQLALYQANAVASLLRVNAEIDCEIVPIRTSGDRMADISLAQAGGKGLFVKEIEDALLAGDIDLAVHSSKDLPATLPAGLTIGAVLPRQDPRDAVVVANDTVISSLEDLSGRCGGTPRIGTSSVRRSAQLSRLIPGARFLAIRGNLDTRLRKLDAGDYDAIVLASAGLFRLGYGNRISLSLSIDSSVPAPGQGIIAVEAQAGNDVAMARIAAIDDRASHCALDAERAVVSRLGGGCQMPLGAFAEVADNTITLVATVLSLDGTRSLRAESRGHMSNARKVGLAVAEALLDQGAETLLAEAERIHAPLERRHS